MRGLWAREASMAIFAVAAIGAPARAASGRQARGHALREFAAARDLRIGSVYQDAPGRITASRRIIPPLSPELEGPKIISSQNGESHFSSWPKWLSVQDGCRSRIRAGGPGLRPGRLRPQQSLYAVRILVRLRKREAPARRGLQLDGCPTSAMLELPQRVPL